MLPPVRTMLRDTLRHTTDVRISFQALGPRTMSNPAVSILVPVHNRPALLEECARSALAQDFRDFEIVVCDNHSTDGTWDVCERLARENPEIVRIFRNPADLGPVRNWKRCLDEARGRFGKFVYSDDLVHPGFLSETLPWIER